MIRYIKGIYTMDVNGGIVVETQSGIGFEVFLPVNSPVYRYNTGDSVMVYTSMIVKEDDMKLYGFHNKDSLAPEFLVNVIRQISEKLVFTYPSISQRAALYVC